MYKIQRSDYAYGCTSMKYCYQDSIESALKVFENYKKAIMMTCCPEHIYTVIIQSDEDVLREYSLDLTIPENIEIYVQP